jgi:hypothetical protein
MEGSDAHGAGRGPGAGAGAGLTCRTFGSETIRGGYAAQLRPGDLSDARNVKLFRSQASRQLQLMLKASKSDSDKG